MIRRSPSVIELRVFEAQLREVQPLHKSINETHRVVRGEVIIEGFRKEQRFAPIGASDVVHAGARACQKPLLSAITTTWERRKSYHTVCAVELTAPRVTPAAGGFVGSNTKATGSTNMPVFGRRRSCWKRFARNWAKVSRAQPM